MALQTLTFVEEYGMNVLVYDDLVFAPLADAVKHGSSFWNVKYFSEYRDQRPIFPNLLLVANIMLTDWNVMYQLYFGWILLTVSLIPMYLMLKSTDQKMHWLIVLIAAFTFNTAQYVSLLMDIASRQMVLAALAIVFSIYFLNRVGKQRRSFLPAMAFTLLASFSDIVGLSLWIIGIFSLMRPDRLRRTRLVVWLSCAIAVFVVYFTNYNYGTENRPLSVHDALSFSSFKLFLLNLSNGLVPAVSSLVKVQTVIGFIILAVILVGSVYLLRRRFVGVLPWSQLGLVGIAYAIMATVAREGETAPLSHYITIAKFAQISAIIIVTVIFLQTYRNSSKGRTKAISSAIYGIIIIVTVSSLSASYVTGWYDGSLYHKEKISYLECMTNPIFNYKCTLIDSESNILYNGGTITRELHLGPFASQADSMMYLHEPLLQESNWKNIKGDLSGLGEIESISSVTTQPNKQIDVNNTEIHVDIVGWGVISKNNTSIDPASKIRERLGIGEKNPKIDSGYVFIDNIVNSQIHYGQLRQDIMESNRQVTTQDSGWNGIIDLSHIPAGCHDVSVRLVVRDHYYTIPSKSQICIS